MFPLMVDLSVGKVVIVGGGKIGYHKVLNLLRFDLEITVISKVFHADFATLESDSSVEILEKSAEWADLAEAQLIILVTDDEAVNDYLARKATHAGKLVVHASNPTLGNVQIPAILQRGKLFVSVSTSGASPTLAMRIRDDLAEVYDGSYEAYLDFLFEVRKLVKQKFPERSDRKKWLREAVSPDYLECGDAARAEFLRKLR